MSTGNFDTPSWFRPGCLPRRTAYGKLRGCPAFRDAIKIIPRSDWPDLLAENDAMRQYVPPCYGHEGERGIYDQDGVGSCASEAKDQSVSIIRVGCGMSWVEFNPWGTYHTVSGGVDQGSTLDDNIAFAMEQGCFPESVWPRSKGWQAKPTDAAYAAAQNYRLLEVFDIGSIDELGTALLLRFPVYYGSEGHAKCYVRMLDPQTGEYANSWAPTWGDRGFGTERFANVNLMYGAFALRSVVDIGAVPTP